MTPSPSLQLGRFLKARRNTLGLSTYQVAELAGIPQSTLFRIEQGEYAAPRPDKIARIATALELPVSELFARMGYLNADDLPDLDTYLGLKYGLEPQRRREVAQLTRGALRSAGVEI